MAGVLDSVDQRTRLVGQNRLEVLMFKLSAHQTFAINVFKVQEVLKLPKMSAMPQRHPVVCGVVCLRGKTIPVINLSQAIGMKPLEPTADSTIVVTEYNRTVQAFLVGGVERIVNMNWDEIMPPPKGAGRNHYLTAITRYKGDIVEIIDVEKVLAEIVPYSTDISEEVVDRELVSGVANKFILLVDDSPVALNQAQGTINKLGLDVVITNNGKEAETLLKHWVENEPDKFENLLMVLTDAEMPVMDGYKLTTAIREDPRLKDLHVVLHTSLSGSFNKAMVEKVGCNGFLSKFQPDDLAREVLNYIKSLKSE